MWVTIESINGANISEKDGTFKSINDVYVLKDGTFKTVIKKYGDLDYYPFPKGIYKLQFYAGFSRAWQSVEVAKLAGVEMDSSGRSDTGEPREPLINP